MVLIILLKAKFWNNIRDIGELKLSQKSQRWSFFSGWNFQIIEAFSISVLFLFLWWCLYAMTNSWKILCYKLESSHWKSAGYQTWIKIHHLLNWVPMVKYFWEMVYTWISTTISILEFCNYVLFKSKTTECCLHISDTHVKTS